MHVYDATLEPGRLAVVWTRGSHGAPEADAAGVYGLAEHEAFELLDALGNQLDQPGLIDGLSSRMTLLLEPGALNLSPAGAHERLALVRPWCAPGTWPGDAPRLTAVTDRLQWPVLHADVAAAADFVARQEQRRPALRGCWRELVLEPAPERYGAPTRLELRLGARRIVAA